MSNKIISKSEKSKTNLIIICIGIILFSFFVYLLNNNFQPKNEYEGKLKIIGLLVLIVIIIYCFYTLLNQKRIYVYEKYFEIKKIFQIEKYFFTEIQTYYSEHFNGRYNSWTEHYLILNTGKKLTLIDSEYSNFEIFFSSIKNRIKRNEKLNIKLSRPKFLKYSIICGIISCLIFYFSSHFYDFKKVKNKDFVYITGKLKGEIKKVTRRKSKNHFEIHLTNKPNLIFKISGENYYGISDNNEFTNLFKAGEKIVVGIKKDDYEKKITNEKKMFLLDKYFHYSTINIQQINDKTNKPLVNLEYVNNFRKENNYIGIGTFSFFGIIFLYLTIGNYRAYVKNNKTTHNNV